MAALVLSARALVTLDEFREAIAPLPGQVTARTQDELLVGLLNKATDWLETYTERRLKTATYTATRVSGTGSRWLTSVEWPITTLTTVLVDEVAQTLWVPGDSADPLTKDVRLLEDGRDPKRTRRRLYRSIGWSPGIENITLTYVAGYGPTGFPVPEDLRTAVLRLARLWYQVTDRQRDGVASRSVGGATVTYETEGDVLTQVQRLADPYARMA